MVLIKWGKIFFLDDSITYDPAYIRKKTYFISIFMGPKWHSPNVYCNFTHKYVSRVPGPNTPRNGLAHMKTIMHGAVRFTGA